jgi:hypothetical protein
MHFGMRLGEHIYKLATDLPGVPGRTIQDADRAWGARCRIIYHGVRHRLPLQLLILFDKVLLSFRYMEV